MRHGLAVLFPCMEGIVEVMREDPGDCVKAVVAGKPLRFKTGHRSDNGIQSLRNLVLDDDVKYSVRCCVG